MRRTNLFFVLRGIGHPQLEHEAIELRLGDPTALDANVAGSIQGGLGVEHAPAREDEIVLLALHSPPRRRERDPADEADEEGQDDEPVQGHVLRLCCVGRTAVRVSSDGPSTCGGRSAARQRPRGRRQIGHICIFGSWP